MEKLQSLLTENESLRTAIPVQFRFAMTASLERVDLAFRPGLITVRWTSLTVEHYFANVAAALDQLAKLIKTVRVVTFIFVCLLGVSCVYSLGFEL